MKCNDVMELFPELMDEPQAYPEARKHLENCDTCRAQFELFRQFLSEDVPALSQEESDAACNEIVRKAARHRSYTLTARISAVAAAVLIVMLTAFGPVGKSVSLKTVPDYVLLEASEADVLPDMQQPDEEDILEYLAYYADLGSLNDIY